MTSKKSQSPLSESAQKVMALAEQAARDRGHTHVGTEHLLIALGQHDDFTSSVLESMGAPAAKVQSAVDFIRGRFEGTATETIGITPRVKKVLELAWDEARQQGVGAIEPKHLLLALTAEWDGIGPAILEGFGLKPENIRRHIVLLTNPIGDEPKPTTGS